MGSGPDVDARLADVEALARAVQRYCDSTAITVERARTSARKLATAAEEAVRESKDQLRRARADTAAAERALAKCSENCSRLASAAAEARRREAVAEKRLERRQRGARMVQDALGDVLASLRTASSGLDNHGRGAVAQMGAYVTQLGHYLDTTV